MASGVEMSAAEQAQIRAMAADGKRPYQIAEALGRVRQSIDNYMRRHGLTRPDARFGPRKERPPEKLKRPVCQLPWPEPDRKKKWPRNCFKGHDASRERLDSEFTRIRDKPPLRSERFGVPTYG